VKHIEFQLQRETQKTKELEEKVKSKHETIVRLEQEKAELRRAVNALQDDDKKKGKLEERIHTLQRELAEKVSQLHMEAKRAQSAESTLATVKTQADTTFEKWIEKEKEWKQSAERMKQQLHDCEGLKAELDATQKKWQKERAAHLDADEQIAQLRTRIQDLQNEVSMREEEMFRLGDAKAKISELVNAKDEERRRLEVELIKRDKIISGLEESITTLNQARQALLYELSEKDKVIETRTEEVDDEKRRAERLLAESDVLKRDLGRLQRLEAHNVMLQEKIAAQLEELNKKNDELRRLQTRLVGLEADLETTTMSLRHVQMSMKTHEAETKKGKEESDRVREERLHAQSKCAELLETVEALNSALRTAEEAKNEVDKTAKEQLASLVGFNEKLQAEVRTRDEIIMSLTARMRESTDRCAALQNELFTASSKCDAFATDVSQAVEELQNRYVRIVELEESNRELDHQLQRLKEQLVLADKDLKTATAQVCFAEEEARRARNEGEASERALTLLQQDHQRRGEDHEALQRALSAAESKVAEQQSFIQTLSEAKAVLEHQQSVEEENLRRRLEDLQSAETEWMAEKRQWGLQMEALRRQHDVEKAAYEKLQADLEASYLIENQVRRENEKLAFELSQSENTVKKYMEQWVREKAHNEDLEAQLKVVTLRKEEHKENLSKAKELVQQERQARAEEKQAARRAVDVLTTEVDYWKKSFAKLKTMYEALDATAGRRAREHRTEQSSPSGTATKENVEPEGKKQRVETIPAKLES
jgi:chromosome segregation ATPase